MFSVFICMLTSPLPDSLPHSRVPEIGTWTSLGELLFWISYLSILVIGWPIGTLELKSTFQSRCFPPCHNSYLQCLQEKHWLFTISVVTNISEAKQETDCKCLYGSPPISSQVMLTAGSIQPEAHFFMLHEMQSGGQL